jgi:Ca2+-binding RTX toxin-like protein
MNRRILLGALIGASAIAAVPSAASATATCNYDSAKRQMQVRYGAGDTAVTVRNGPGLVFREGTSGFRNCFSTTGVRATAANTNSVSITAATGTGAAQQTTTIDETNGDFSDSNSKLRFGVVTGTGADRLVVKEGSGNNFVTVRNQSSGLGFGPEIDLDSDGDADINKVGFDNVVQINGGSGNDILDAGPNTTAQMVLLGEAGNDTLRGGSKQDNLDGGIGNDGFFSKDGVTDIVTGGSGTDHAKMDFNLDRPSSIEEPSF